MAGIGTLAVAAFVAACALAPVMGEGSTGPVTAGTGEMRDDIPLLVVLDLEPEEMPPEDAIMISRFIRMAMVKSRMFAVVDEKNMDAMLAEQGFRKAEWKSRSDAAELGRLLNAQAVLMGTYSRFAGRHVMSAQLVDVKTGQIVSSEAESFGEVEEVEEAVDRLVSDLLEPIRLEERVETPEPGVPARQHSVRKWLIYGGAAAAVFALVVLTL